MYYVRPVCVFADRVSNPLPLVDTQVYDTSTIPVSAPEAHAVLCRMTELDVEIRTLMVQRDIRRQPLPRIIRAGTVH